MKPRFKSLEILVIVGVLILSAMAAQKFLVRGNSAFVGDLRSSLGQFYDCSEVEVQFQGGEARVHLSLPPGPRKRHPE